MKYTAYQGASRFLTSEKSYSEIIYALNAKGKSLATINKLLCTECKSDYRVEMHHIRQLADIKDSIKPLNRLMTTANRKQIPLCRRCHMLHHKK